MFKTVVIPAAAAVGLLLTIPPPMAHANASSTGWVVEVKPDAGRVKVPTMKPAWCDLVAKKTASRGVTSRSRFRRSGRSGRSGRSRSFSGRRRSRGPSTSYVRRSMGAAQRNFYEKYTTSIASGLCDNPNDSSWQLQTGYFVQMYVNLTGMNTKQAVAAIRARLQAAKWKSQRKAFCSTLTVSDEASPAQKRRLKAQSDVFGCGRSVFWRDPSHTLGSKLEWDHDRHAQIGSEVLKAHYVLGCFRRSHHAKLSDKHSLLPYAVCGIDARSLSLTKLEAELANRPHNTYSRTLARETFASAKAAALRLRVLVDTLAKRNGTYKKIFYTIPETAWKTWQKTHAANKSLFEASLAYEDKLYGPSKSALKVCLPTLRKHLGDHLRRTKPRTVKAVQQSLSDQVASTLLAALMPCAAVDANKWEADAYRKLYRKAAHVRGPRYAAYYALASAIGKIRKDRTRFPISVRMLAGKRSDSVLAKTSHLAKRGLSKDGFGVVRRMKRVRGGVKLIFKTVRWKEDTWECTSNGKIWRIEPNGQVKYHTDCVSTGKQWRTQTEKPIIIPAYATKGIRRGSFVELTADYPFTQANYRRYGFPLRVWRSKKKRKLVSAYGYKL